jgi:hypothetical protein
MTLQRDSGTPRGGQLPENPSIGDVKRYLARLIRRVDKGRVPVPTANCLSQICNVIINAICDHELEQRLDRLEVDRDAGRLAPSGSLTIRTGGTHHDETTPTGTA